MTTQTPNKAPSKAEALKILWGKGSLSWKLHAGQKVIYDALKGGSAGQAKKVYLNCARRFGKSYLLCLIAIEHCLTTKRAVVRYAAPHQSDAEEIARDLIAELIQDCPKHLAPVYNSHRKVYTFPSTGAVLKFAGVNKGNAGKLRGRKATLVIADELGEWDDVDYALNSILLPQTLTTGGKILIASTPARSPGHESTGIARICEEQGAYFRFTVYDNPLITEDVRATYCKESGGEESSTWRREYLCEFVTDTENAVIPSFTDRRRAELVKAVERPLFFDAYVGADVGRRDLTVALFGYWHWELQALVIEDEVVLKNVANTQAIAEAFKAKEAELWGLKRPYKRVSDDGGLFLPDLRGLYGYHVDLAIKTDKEANVALLDTWIANGKVLINPRCRTLIATLHGATWNKTRTSFERTKEIGHADALDALLYLFRSIAQNRNPTPHNHGAHSDSHFIRVSNPVQMDEGARTLLESFDALPE